MKRSLFRIPESRDYMLCMNHPSMTIETDLGFIEYADRGIGPVILSIHGSPGGFDQGLGMAEIFRKNGYRVMAVSRPGYLNTPWVKETPENQTELLVSLLDTLKLNKVIVVSASTGGSIAYTLAQNYPTRISALLTIASASMSCTKLLENSKMNQWSYLNSRSFLLILQLKKYFPRLLISRFLHHASSLSKSEISEQAKIIAEDEIQFQIFKLMVARMTQNFDQRKTGQESDLKILIEMNKLKMDKITCPTLIIHGTHDANVEPIHAENAANSIAGSNLLWIEKGSHIGFWIGENALKTQKKAIQWLNSIVKNEDRKSQKNNDDETN